MPCAGDRHPRPCNRDRIHRADRASNLTPARPENRFSHCLSRSQIRGNIAQFAYPPRSAHLRRHRAAGPKALRAGPIRLRTTSKATISAIAIRKIAADLAFHGIFPRGFFWAQLATSGAVNHGELIRARFHIAANQPTICQRGVPARLKHSLSRRAQPGESNKRCAFPNRRLAPLRTLHCRGHLLLGVKRLSKGCRRRPTFCPSPEPHSICAVHPAGAATKEGTEPASILRPAPSSSGLRSETKNRETRVAPVHRREFSKPFPV